jgi:uncharacterized repeat protein (TIGR01451 family)
MNLTRKQDFSGSCITNKGKTGIMTIGANSSTIRLGLGRGFSLRGQRRFWALIAAFVLALTFLSSGVIVPPPVAEAAPYDCKPNDIFVQTDSPSRLLRYSPDGTLLSDIPFKRANGTVLTSGFTDIAVTPDGTKAYLLSSSGDLTIFDTETGILQGTLLLDLPGGGVWNGLSFAADGRLLIGQTSTLNIYAVNTTTGAFTVWNTWPSGRGSAGDFLTLANGDVIGVSKPIGMGGGSPSQLVRFRPNGTKIIIGTVPETFGAAQSEGYLYLAGSDGVMRKIAMADLPTTATTANLSLTTVATYPRTMNGASSPQDVGCPAINVDKAVDHIDDVNDDDFTDAGDRIWYKFTVTNTGTESLSGIKVSDPMLADAGITVSCPSTTLAPDDSLVCTASAGYVITAADQKAGVVHNEATATGSPPSGSDVTSDPRELDVPVEAPPPGVLEYSKSAKPASGQELPPGSSATVTLTFENSGGLPVEVDHTDVLTDVLDDGDVSDVESSDSALTAELDGDEIHVTGEVPGGKTYTVTYTVKAKAGGDGVMNNFLVPDGETPPTTCPESGAGSETCTTHPVPPAKPGISVVKSADPETASEAGDVIEYSFEVTNTGNVPLTDLSVVDTLAAPAGPALTVTCPVSELAAGKSTTCTASYTVTPADVDHGSIDNSAVATGTPDDGDPNTTDQPVTSDPSTETVNIPADPGLTVVKSASPASVAAAGDVIEYSFKVTNTGNVTMSDIAVHDTLTAPAGPALTVTCPETELAVEESMTCTASYLVTAADIDNGLVHNSAVVEGTPPGGGDPETSDPSETTVPAVPAPGLSVTKSASPDSVSAVGDVIEYSFLVKNTGNVTLTGIAVTDTLSAPAGPELAVTCPVDELAAGASTTCTATYTVTQADLDNGLVHNSAVVQGTPPGGGDPETSGPSETTVPVVPEPGVSATKSAVPASGEPLDVGQSADVTLTFTNPGRHAASVDHTDVLTDVVDDADVSDVAVSNPALTATLSGDQLVVTGSVPAGETYTVTYTMTAKAGGNGVANNFLVHTGDTPPTDCVVSGDGSGGENRDAGESDPDKCTTHPVEVPEAGLTVTKSASLAMVSTVGEEIEYSFLVKNTGEVPLTDVKVVDTLTAPAGPALQVSCPETELAVGASTTCTATYKVTQADLDNGSVRNSAVAEGMAPGAEEPEVSDPSAAIVRVNQQGNLLIDKTVSPYWVDTAGDEVEYSFTVTNPGNVTMSEILISDYFDTPEHRPAPEPVCPSTVLDPGESMVCTSIYALTQDDIDRVNGYLVNTAQVWGTPPGGQLSMYEYDRQMVGVEPVLHVLKTADRESVSAVGDMIEYTFEISASRLPEGWSLHKVTLEDTLAAPAGPALDVTCSGDYLDGAMLDEPIICKATYVVTQADLDHGSVHNSAVAKASTGICKNINTCPVDWPGFTQAPDLVSDPSEVTVPVVSPGLSVVKSASPASVSKVGDVIDYSFAVTNTGNVTMTDITVTDTLSAPAGPALDVVCPVTELAAGASTTCTAEYTVTQADLDNGSVHNSAIVEGTPPDDGDPNTPNEPVPSGPSEVTVPADQAPGLSVTKSASPETVSAVGDVVDYSFLVTNTGNVSLTDVKVVDTMDAPASPASLDVVCPKTVLAPGESTTCTAPYTVTQADVDHLWIHNVAVAEGTGPDSDGDPTTPEPPTTSGPSEETVYLDIVRSISLVKSASPASVSAVGQVITYSFEVTNTGNVPTDGIVVTDTLSAPAGPALDVTCPETALAAGKSMTCTATYLVTQADLDNGLVHNVAVATSSGSPALPDPVDPITSDPSEATVPAEQAPGLSVVKSASPASVSAVGDVIDYSFLVTNTGNVAMTGITVTDTLSAPAGPALTVVCPVTELAAGASTTCTASYEVTQADLDAGQVHNSAIVEGTPPDDGDPNTPNEPVPSGPSEVTVPADQAPGLSVTKSASPASVSAVGDVIDYSFLVTNTGNVTLTGIAVTDTLSAPAGPALTVVCPVTELAPQVSTTCTASYEVTQADLDNGSVHNSAIVEGTPPDDGDPSTPNEPVPSDPSEVTVPADQSPGLSVVKSASPASVSAVGDVIDYSFLVTNTGNVAMTGIAVTDTLSAPAGPALTVVCPVTELAAGASTTCTASYEVTQADLDNGSVHNSAIVEGTPPDDGDPSTPNEPVPSDPSEVTVPADQAPGLSVVKSASTDLMTEVGQVIDYSFLVTNTGNVNLTDVKVVDTMDAPASPASLDVVCPETELAPGESTTCTASYTVTRADLNNFRLHNVAVAEGTGPDSDGDPATPEPPTTSGPSEETVYLNPIHSVSVVKSASPASVSSVGQVIEYSFLVTNTSNIRINDIVVNDTLSAPAGPALTVTCPVTELAAGESTTCTADYVVTQADLDNGLVHNSAVVSAGSPDLPDPVRPVTSEPSEVTVPAEQAPGLSVVKSASPASVSAVGDRIDYSFLVTNTGNVTLTAITVTDTLTAPAGPALDVVCPVTELAAGANTTCTASYTVTQADLDSGRVHNSAIVEGTPPDDGDPNTPDEPVPSDPSEVTVPTDHAPGLSVVKSASPATVSKVGGVVEYSFLVTNTGNVTLTELRVTDTLSAPAGPALTVSCPVTELAGGESATCTASYTVTQADLDNGSVHNSAIAEGTPPDDGDPSTPNEPVPSDPSETTVPAEQGPGLSVVKSASPASVSAVGDVIEYSFEVTNTGNVAMTDITVKDTLSAPAGPALEVTCPGTELAAGKSMTCTATYVVTQADLDAGQVRNSAVVEGTPPDDGDPSTPVVPVPSDPSEVVVPADPKPGLSVTKSASPATVSKVGDVIDYSFLVTNTGNVTMTGITVTDTLAAPAGPALTVTCPGTELAAGKSMTCTASYTVTQADLDNGQVRNSAVVEGTPPDDGDPNTPVVPVPSDPSEVVVPAVQGPAVSLVKSAGKVTDANGDGVQNAGDTIRYTFTVTNTGNVVLTNVRLTDAKLGLDAIECGAAPLKPGDSRECEPYIYTLTAADIAAGKVVNDATVTATPPSGDPVRDSSSVTSPLKPGGGSDGDGGGQLAFTGAEVTSLLVGAAVLILIGGLVLLVSRRRTEGRRVIR